MSAARPDVTYSILDVDMLKRTDPDRAGTSLCRIMDRLAAGELSPLPHAVWPLREIESAMDAMRGARHLGKNVLRMPPLAGGGLRADRAYSSPEVWAGSAVRSPAGWPSRVPAPSF